MRKVVVFLFIISLINVPRRIISESNILNLHKIKIHGFNPSQIQIINKTLSDIKHLRPGKLKINKNVYKKNSTFFKLFGFHFSGVKLINWILNRFDEIQFHNGWTVAINRSKGLLLIGNAFFSSSLLERMYILVHEARHSDGFGHSHKSCPQDFKYVSVGQPDKDLSNAKGCDDEIDGAYGFQAAFLFELYSFGLVDFQKAGFMYNSSLIRILPYHNF